MKIGADTEEHRPQELTHSPIRGTPCPGCWWLPPPAAPLGAFRGCCCCSNRLVSGWCGVNISSIPFMWGEHQLPVHPSDPWGLQGLQLGWHKHQHIQEGGIAPSPLPAIQASFLGISPPFLPSPGHFALCSTMHVSGTAVQALSSLSSWSCIYPLSNTC